MELDPLDAAILRQLESTPRTWQDIDNAEGDSLDDKALYLLIHAGMIEARRQHEVRLDGEADIVRVVSVESGESPDRNWWGVLIWPNLPPSWLDADGKTRSRLEIDSRILAARRTSHGELALKDIYDGREVFTFSFVRRLGVHGDRATVTGEIILKSRELVHKPTQTNEAQPQPAETSPSRAGQRAQLALEAFAGDELKELMEIFHSDRSSSDKAEAICDIDKRFLAWESPQWAEVLGVSEGAIRRGKFWRKIRPTRIAKEQDGDS